MRWLKRDMWKIGIVLTGVLLFLLLFIGIPMSTVSAKGNMGGAATPTPATVQATPAVDVTVTVLAKQKLQEDVDQGQHTFGNWFWTNAAALFSVIAVIGGGFIGFIQWLREQRNARILAEQTARTERDIAVDNQRETSMQEYIDRMSDLLLEKGLLDPGTGHEVREIARARTLNVLSRLDPNRKESVIRFLSKSGLLNVGSTIVDLRFADLRGANLEGADLQHINLSGTDLRDANLRGARLINSDLSDSNLSGVDFNGADLSGANIEKARSMDHINLGAVKGLTPEQLKACEARGAIVDKAPMASPPQAPVSPPPPSQNSNLQAPSAPSAQVNTPSPSTDGSSSTSAQPSAEP